MPTEDEIRACLRSLLHQIGGIPMDRITESATVEGELQMSSLAFVELQVALEEEYGVQIDPIQIVELSSFGAIADYVHRLAVATEPA